MCAYRIAGRSASRPVCGKYRIDYSCFFALPRRNAALAVKFQSKLCIFRSFTVSLREGFFLLKKETDSKAINALPSVWISCFPSVGHLLYGYFICATWKMQVFSGSILSKNERKIVQKTACRLNLQISDNVRTFLCTYRGMNVWWELTKRYVWMISSI